MILHNIMQYQSIRFILQNNIIYFIVLVEQLFLQYKLKFTTWSTYNFMDCLYFVLRQSGQSQVHIGIRSRYLLIIKYTIITSSCEYISLKIMEVMSFSVCEVQFVIFFFKMRSSSAEVIVFIRNGFPSKQSRHTRINTGLSPIDPAQRNQHHT